MEIFDKRFIIHGIIGTAIMIACLLLNSSVAYSEEQRVDLVIITSYPASSVEGNEMIQELVEEISKTDKEVRYYTEFLYTNKGSLAKDFSYVEERMAEKYAHMDIEVVVTLGIQAYQYIQQSNHESWNDAILFSGGIDYYEVEEQEKRKDFFGNMTRIEPEEYLNLIKAVQPNLKVIYCALGSNRWINSHLPLIYAWGEEEDVSIVQVDVGDENTYATMTKHTASDEAAMIISYHGYNVVNERYQLAKDYKKFREYYYGTLYLVGGGDHQAVFGENDVGIPPVGGVVRNLAKEGEALGKLIYKGIEEGWEVAQNVEVLNGETYLDYEGLEVYGRANPAVLERYNVKHVPAVEWIIPSGSVVELLFVVIMLLLGITSILLLIIRQRKSLIQQIAIEKVRYKLLISLLPQAIIEVKNKRISYLNQSAVILLEGKHANEFLGKPIDGFIIGNLLCNIDGQHKRIIANGGVEKEVEVSSAEYYCPYFTQVLLLRDLTQQKLLREQKEYNHLRKEFFANLSHDLRTPINVILSAVQLLEKLGQQETQLSSYHQILKQNSYRLVRLINNLIDFTKLEAGFTQLNLMRYNIVEVTENVVEAILPFARDKGLKVIFDPALEELYLDLDKEKYERALLNVLSNGIKYSKEQGTILVSLACDYGVIEIGIRDEGIGIPKGHLKTIFDPFIQVDKSSTRKVEGSGIGLAIVKGMIELHGGYVQIDSVEDWSTEVTFYLPGEKCISEPEDLPTSYGPTKEMIYTELADIDFDEKELLSEKDH